MLLLCVWLKLFWCRFVPLLEPNPSMLAQFARSGSQSHPPLKNPRSANVLCYYLCCFNLTVFWPASDAYCLLEVYEVLTAKIDEYKIPLHLRSEDADYSSCVAKTKLEKKQDRISKKCDMPLTEVMTLICVHTAYVHRESKKTRHPTLGHNFTNYYPIFKFFH